MRCAAATTRRPCFFFAGVKTPLHEILIKFLSCFRTLRARQEIRCTFCCWPPGPLARRERRAYPVRYVRSEQHRQRACGPQPGGARRRAGICFVAAPRRCTPASPASRRLASARPALAPKCTPYFLPGPKLAAAFVRVELLGLRKAQAS